MPDVLAHNCLTAFSTNDGEQLKATLAQIGRAGARLVTSYTPADDREIFAAASPPTAPGAVKITLSLPF